MHAATTGVAGPTDVPQPQESEGTWITEDQWVRRPLGGRFWAAALLLPLVLVSLVAVSRAPAVEQSVQDRAERALRRAGLDSVRVVVEGRRVLAMVPRGARDPRVRATLSAVPGVWLVGTVPLSASSIKGSRVDREGGARHGRSDRGGGAVGVRSR